MSKKSLLKTWICYAQTEHVAAKRAEKRFWDRVTMRDNFINGTDYSDLFDRRIKGQVLNQTMIQNLCERLQTANYVVCEKEQIKRLMETDHYETKSKESQTLETC